MKRRKLIPTAIILETYCLRRSAELLLNSDEENIKNPYLRPGLYLATRNHKLDRADGEVVFFWPEKSTWEDGAMTNVSCNRITFMR